LFQLSALSALYRVMLFVLLEAFGTLPGWLTVKTRWEKLRGQVSIPVDEPGVKKGQ